MSESPPPSAVAVPFSEQKPAPKSGAPTWDPKRKRQQTQLRVVLLVSGVAAITVAVIYWVLTQTITQVEVKPLPVGANLTLILAPVLAASAGVERFLETIFGMIEGNARTLVAYLGRGMRWLHNTEVEVESARQWLANVSAEYHRQLTGLPFSGTVAATTESSGASDPQASPKDPQQVFALADSKLKSAKELMDLAEKRLEIAENQLREATDSDGYRNAKRAACIYTGLLLGLVVAAASSLQMFALMGIKVGDPRIDVFVTGMVIGSGAAPVHSLINILQSAKDTLDSAQSWLDAARKKPARSEESKES